MGQDIANFGKPQIDPSELIGGASVPAVYLQTANALSELAGALAQTARNNIGLPISSGDVSGWPSINTVRTGKTPLVGTDVPAGDLATSYAAPTVSTVHGGKAITDNTQALSGDLTGTLPGPTVAKINGNSIPAGATIGQELVATGASATAWSDPLLASSGVALVTNPKFGAKCNAIAVADGAMALNSSTLACTGSVPFTSGAVNIGQAVKVQGAGNAGGTLDLVTTITGFTDTGHVTLGSSCLNSAGVTAAQVVFGNNDTSAVQTASNVGNDIVVKFPAGTSTILDSWSIKQCELDLRGVVVYQVQSLNRGCIGWQGGGADIPVTNRVHVIGGVFFSFGNEQQNNVPIYMADVLDLLIRDCIFLNFAAQSIYIADSQRVRVENTVTVTNGTTPGATNYIEIFYIINAVGSSSPREVFIRGNYVNAPNGAASALGITSSNVTNSNSTFPFRGVVTDNNFEVKASCITLECGGTGVPLFYIQRLIIAQNQFTIDSTTGTQWCVNIRDDSTSGSADPNLITDMMVVNNVMNATATGANGGGVLVQTLRGIIGWNIMRIGASNTNAPITLNDHQGSGVGYNHVVGNVISCADGANPSTAVIYLFHQQNSLVALNTVVFDTGGGGGAQDAVYLQNCTDCSTMFNALHNLPGRGIHFNNPTNCKSRFDEVVNPCTSNGNSAVYVDGAGGSGVLIVTGGLFIDERTLTTPAQATGSASGTGSTVTAGNYLAKVTYVNSLGESIASAESATITVAAGNNLIINSPATPIANGSQSITGWYAYVTQVGGASGTETRQQASGSPTALGTNLTLTANPTNTGAAPPATNTSGKMIYALNNQGTTNAKVYTGGDNHQLGAITASTNGAWTALAAF